MRVALAGAGSFAKYFIEELPRAGHEIVLLTRSFKPHFDGKAGIIEQRVTDYSSVEQLAKLLDDCDALVSTISDHTQLYVDVHVALIEACKQSPKCKRFIPAEYGSNTEDFPEEPGTVYQSNRVVRDTLASQTDLEWTVISLGWLADYVVSSANRFHPDLGPLFALDLNAKTLTVPGTGNEKFAVTSARDTATAVGELLKSKNKWRPYTYIQDEETTWLSLGKTVSEVTGVQFEISNESVADLEAVLAKNESFESAAVAEFKLYVPHKKLEFDQAKVQRDRDEIFTDVHFRSLKELLEAAKKNPTRVV